MGHVSIREPAEHGYGIRFSGISAGILLSLLAAPAQAVQSGAPANGPEMESALSAVSALDLLQVGGGMGLVILAIVVCAWVARRLLRMPAGLHGQLRVVAGVSMGTREKVVLLQVGETQLLLGVAPGRIQTLHVLDRPLEAHEPAPAPGSGFTAQLSHALRHARAARGHHG